MAGVIYKQYITKDGKDKLFYCNKETKVCSSGRRKVDGRCDASA